VNRGESREPVGRALERIAYGTVAVTTRALSAVDLEMTFAQWRLLIIVGNDPDGTTMSDLALRLGAALSPTSRLASRMARRGWVSLVKDDLDRRVTLVRLTESGREIRGTVVARRRELIAEIVDEAGAVSPDAAAALDRIAEAFRRYL
jgi:DNA-binding MarR family transcriptional regulator